MTGHGSRPEKLHALTSLRFFAALFVVCFHTAWGFLPWIKHDDATGRLLGMGYVSVSFFFLLSGYILGVVYLRRGGPVAVRDFYWARFARVYPLFFLTLVLDTPNLLLSRIATYGLKSAVLKTLATFLGNVAMLHAWFLQLRGIDNPNWSLSVETLFYLTFPFLGVALWKLRGVRLWLTAAGLYLGGIALIFAATRFVKDETANFFPCLHLTTFALGILLARWQTLAREKESETSSASGMRPLSVTLLALACFAAVVHWSPQAPSPFLYGGLLAPIFAAVLWSFSQPQWSVAKWFGMPWLVLLGEASFGLYLFHIPVLHLFERLKWAGVTSLYPVYLGLCIGLSVLSFYFFETPMRRWILKRKQTHVKETMELASDAQ